MKNFTTFIALYTIVALMLLGFTSCSESRAEKGSKARKAASMPPVKESYTVSYSPSGYYKITVRTTMQGLKVLRYDSTVVSSSSGDVMHQTTILAPSERSAEDANL